MERAREEVRERQEIHRLGAQFDPIPHQLQALVAYWDEKRDGRALPLREDLGGAGLRPWAGHLALFEAFDDQDFLFRACDANLIRRFGRVATNRPIGDLATDLARHLRAVLSAALDAKGPVVATSGVALGYTILWHCELALPLGSRDHRRMVLLGSFPSAKY
ncbi:MAG TPA: PAS domain-containing protein [Rhizomicrobium sp.]|nr:PAS domain-containing protein [Rhizomicrobium sp.]